MLATMPAVTVDPVLRAAVGGRIKELRKAREWTLKDLATRLGVRHTHLAKYESGVHAPPLEKLAQLAESFGVTVDFLVTGRQPDNRPISSLPLLERFRALEQVPREDQNTVVNLIDAFIFKNRVASALHPVAPTPPLANAG
jgi:transcriptional regulator with XRE-family HTH domain